MRGRDADGAGDVVRVRDRHEPGGDGRAGAAGATAGGPVEIPRVVGGTVRQRFRGPHERQLGCVRPPDHDEPGCPDGVGQRAVRCRPPAQGRQPGHPLVVGLAGQLGAEALEEEGHTAERTVRQGPARLAERLLEASVHDGVERLVLLLDPPDGRLHQLDGLDLAGPDELGQAGGVSVEVGHGSLLLGWHLGAGTGGAVF